MLDEGTLRERFPEIAWDQPVLVSAPNGEPTNWWACRYCVALLDGRQGWNYIESYQGRAEALDHIEREHHDKVVGTRPSPHPFDGPGQRCLACGDSRSMHPGPEDEDGGSSYHRLGA